MAAWYATTTESDCSLKLEYTRGCADDGGATRSKRNVAEGPTLRAFVEPAGRRQRRRRILAGVATKRRAE